MNAASAFDLDDVIKPALTRLLWRLSRKRERALKFNDYL
jgi:hypothetical protein